MFECLKTGLHFHVNEHDVYHCDMYGDLVGKRILITGFAKDKDEYEGGYHATWDKTKNRIVPTAKFEEFMKEWNGVYEGWETWKWSIDDLYCRFENFIRTPLS